MKTLTFEELKAKWYAKLILKGFRDIELSDRRRTLVLFNNKSHIDKQSRVCREAIEEYYRWAGRMAYDGRFKSTRDKRMWRMHAEGVHHGQIAREFGLERSWISRRIRSIETYLKQNHPKRAA